jgi:hypothetical protein
LWFWFALSLSGGDGSGNHLSSCRFAVFFFSALLFTAV